MLRLSKLTDYAVVVLVRLESSGGVTTSPCLSQDTGIPEPTVAKVLKALAASGLVVSQRGARGGYPSCPPAGGDPGRERDRRDRRADLDHRVRRRRGGRMRGAGYLSGPRTLGSGQPRDPIGADADHACRDAL